MSLLACFIWCGIQAHLDVRHCISSTDQTHTIDHTDTHRGGVFFFQSGSCSPRAQLIRPPNSLDGIFGTLSTTSKISSRSAFGSVILPDFVGTPLIGASRLHAGANVGQFWSCTSCREGVCKMRMNESTCYLMQSRLVSEFGFLVANP